MVAQAALAVLAALTVIGGAGAAAVATGVISLDNGNTINLGALTPGMSGNATIKSVLNLNTTSQYKFEMEKEDQIGSAFSSFQVYVTLNGTTYNLSSGNPHDYFINMSAGSHTFTVKLIYVVGQAQDSINASKVPFLFLHASGNDGNSKGIKDSASVEGSSENSSGNSGTYTVATLSFTMAGNSTSHGEDSGSDNAVVRSLY